MGFQTEGVHSEGQPAADLAVGPVVGPVAVALVVAESIGWVVVHMLGWGEHMAKLLWHMEMDC